MSSSLKYIDENDKAYGLAGMAISLLAWDAEEWLESINIDAPADAAMQMSADFYLTLAPKVSAKALWEQASKRFQLTAAMTVANVACRQMTLHHHASLSGEIDSELRSLLADEGAELCGYESDEVSRLYGRALAYCSRLFNHSGVCRLADQLAARILDARTLDAPEIFTILAPLNRM
ncbi:MAG: hypothetical protein K2L05_04965 [Muribaculaceae bacterium]|nr:hypothetical protein [Muribaculaceae bacterium]MDE7336244.1 hypothetical protein [Muribaculaceae bacterium]